MEAIKINRCALRAYFIVKQIGGRGFYFGF